MLSEQTDRDNADDAREREVQKRNRRKNRLFWGGIVTVLVIAAGAGTFGVANLIPAPEERFETAEEVAEREANAGDGKEGVTVAGARQEFFDKPETAYPLRLEEWQLAPVDAAPSSETFEAIGAKYVGSTLRTAAMTLPSEASGYTSDLAQNVLEDGTLNPLFSYWTQESFIREVGFIFEKLLNPRFGGWEIAQYDPEAFSAEGLRDVFAPAWWEANGGNPQAFPLYIDWSGDAYGMGDTLLANGTRWIGEATDLQAGFTYNEETLQYSAQVVAQLRFTAWTQDQKQVTKDGTLTLVLVPTPEDASANTPLRVLVESASLEVN
ncbi:hypothetical protein DC432_15660 [Microbacterium testaceum]|uniref:Uncharacterized protein n=2 Tax=Microbacterium testaceum TaxID=2033 RepID=A0A2T7VPU7_MICTE|nr:hypothetical protein DC432_15660 [Microbacterium testaceum]